MFCWNCGRDVEDSHLFCTGCGARVRTLGAPPIQRMMPPVQQSVQPIQQTQLMWQEQESQQGLQQAPYGQAQDLQQQHGYQTPSVWQTQQQQHGYQTPTVYQAQQQQHGYQTPPVYQAQQQQQGYRTPSVWQIQQLDPRWTAQALAQKGTFSIKFLPIALIAILTVGLYISSSFVGSRSLTLALLFSGISGLALLFLVYKTDRIEPEPFPLLIKLFLLGAIVVPIVAIIVESIIDLILYGLFGGYPILYSVLRAFIMAATVEELGKYAVLKLGSWKHPAFNFRFDGIVYAATVAMGFEIVENIEYIAISGGLGTALLRAAIPGHLIFAIYMGYYYGQAKSHEVWGDLKGSAGLRRKAVIIPIIIHGMYDSICFLSGLLESDLLLIGSVVLFITIMLALNVTAYINIKRFAFEDRHI